MVVKKIVVFNGTEYLIEVAQPEPKNVTLDTYYVRIAGTETGKKEFEDENFPGNDRDRTQVAEDIAKNIGRYLKVKIKITKIHSFTTDDGIVIDLEDKTQRVIKGTLLQELKNKTYLKNITPSNIPIDKSKPGIDCKGLEAIDTYSDISMFSKEDLKALAECEYPPA